MKIARRFDAGYVPIRKALDMLEECGSFAGAVLELPPAASVRVFSDAVELDRDADGGFVLAPAKGRLLLEVRDFFAH